MHPLNKLDYGSTAGSIKVSFHNGSSVVTGFIVKQTSATKWVVATTGAPTVHYTCKLAPTGTPVAGQFTVQAFPLTNGSAGSAQHVKKIDGHHISTVEGNRYMWTLGNPTAAGYAKLDII